MLVLYQTCFCVELWPAYMFIPEILKQIKLFPDSFYFSPNVRSDQLLQLIMSSFTDSEVFSVQLTSLWNCYRIVSYLITHKYKKENEMTY